MNIVKKIYRKVVEKFVCVSDYGQNNLIDVKSKMNRSFHIYVYGNNNIIKISPNAKCLSNTVIKISGNNNKLIIEELANFTGPCQIAMDGNSTLIFSKWSGIRGVRFLLKNANVNIGYHCMFSYGITVRNHDSHYILDSQTLEPTNHPKDINIGSEVWIGEGATILKGVSIGDNSVVAMNSVVTKGCGEGCILAGNPAKIVKENILWKR